MLGGRLRWRLCAGAVATLVLVLAQTGAAWAVDAQPPFKNPAREQLYQTIIHEIRCLQCLDESVADSAAPLAAQMRLEVHRRVAAGQSEQQILDYFVSRYGDFILYSPPLQANTWLLWAAPFILLVIGGLVFARILRQRSSQSLDEETID